MAIFATPPKRLTDDMFIEAGQAAADQVPTDLLKPTGALETTGWSAL